jgi:hypothetical protein
MGECSANLVTLLVMHFLSIPLTAARDHNDLCESSFRRKKSYHEILILIAV